MRTGNEFWPNGNKEENCANGCLPLSPSRRNSDKKKGKIEMGQYCQKDNAIDGDRFDTKKGTGREQQQFKELPKYKISQIQVHNAFERLPEGAAIVRKKKLSLSKDIRNASNSSDRSKVNQFPKKTGIKRFRPT